MSLIRYFIILFYILIFSNQAIAEELKKIEPKLTHDVLKVFDLKNSVNSKKSYGGTSFDNIKKMIIKYKKH